MCGKSSTSGVIAVRGQIRRPGDGQVAVRRQLADARHVVTVEQRPHVGAEPARSRLELPAEELFVEGLCRGHVVDHQAHPAWCAGRVPSVCQAVRAGRLRCLGHRLSLLGPSWWPPRFRLPDPRADAHTVRGRARSGCVCTGGALRRRMPCVRLPARFRTFADGCRSAVQHVADPVRLVIGPVRRAE